jgi:sulfide dehydrogenase cytochrome subunit
MSHLRIAAVAAILGSCLSLPGCQSSSPPSGERATAATPAAISASAAGNMANNCFGCHGPNGVSPGSIPSIHQFSAEYLAQTMRAFKSGARASTVMGRHASAYSDAEIDAIARHIADLPKRPGGAR